MASPTARQLLLKFDPEDVNQPPPIDGGIPLVLSINLIIFMVAWAVYLFLRPKDGEFWFPKNKKLLQKRFGVLSFTNFPLWIADVLQAPEDEVGRLGGMYGMLYLKFQRYMFYFIIFMTIIALPILLPLNVLGGEADQAGFAQTTSTNIGARSPALIAHLILTVLFVIVALLIITLYQYQWFAAQRVFQQLDFVNAHTVMVENVRRSFAVSSELYRFVNMLYPGEVAAAHVAYDAPKLVKLKHEKQSALKRVWHEQAVFENRGRKRQTWRGRCGWCITCVGCCYACRKSVDAESYWRARAEFLSERIKLGQKKRLHTTGVAFITFNECDVAHACIRDFYIRHRRRALLDACEEPEMVRATGAARWTITKADANVIWQNLGHSRWNRNVRKLLISLLVLFMAATWAIPVSLLASIESLLAIPGLGAVVEFVVDLHPLVQQLIENYIPTLMTAGAIVLFPFFLEWLCQFEKPHTKAELNTSIQRNYFTFILFNVLVFPTLFIGSLSSYAKIADEGFESVAEINFALHGAFYINYVIQRTFLSGLVRLLRPHQFVWRWLKLRFWCESDYEHQHTRAFVHNMEYRVRFAQTMIIMAILLTFAVVVPLVLVTGLLYLVTMHLYDKNNILNVYPRNTEDGSMIAHVINQFLVCCFTYELAMIAFFYIKRAYWGVGVMCGLVALTSLWAIGLKIWSRSAYHRYITRGAPQVIDWDLPPSLLDNAYRHPVLEPEDPIEEQLHDVRHTSELDRIAEEQARTDGNIDDRR